LSHELSGHCLSVWRATAAAIAVGGLALDQVTKALAERHLDPLNPPSCLGGFLKLQLIHNSGAAFSMGSGATMAISIFAVIALTAVLVWVMPGARHRWSLISCGMVLAGISGNLVDRIWRAPGPLRGHVVDFISLPHFAIFNVADVFITVTAVLAVVMSIFGHDDTSGSGVADARTSDRAGEEATHEHPARSRRR